MTTHPKVSVVIPFFQRESGILEKAVLSALRQKNVDNYEIIVVDDGSPVSARAELQKLLESHAGIIRIIEQSNMGEGAARNKGIDSVSPDTKYIASLDSDDEWTEDHLENAIFALEKGYDLYFADFDRNEWGVSYLKRNNYFNYEEMTLVDRGRGLYELGKKPFDLLLLKGNFIGMPTGVYRYEKMPYLRFKGKLAVGEDMLFWLRVMEQTDRVIFSSHVHCHCGRGVNMCFSAQWGSRAAIIGAHRATILYKAILSDYRLDPAQIVIVRNMIKESRFGFTKVLVHNMLHLVGFDPMFLIAQLKIDPMTFVSLFPNIIKLCIIRLRASVRRKNFFKIGKGLRIL